MSDERFPVTPEMIEAGEAALIEELGKASDAYIEGVDGKYILDGLFDLKSVMPAIHRAMRAREPETDGWLPIETAPKDGTDIFVWGSTEWSPLSRPHIGSEDIERVYWDDRVEGWVVCSAQADGIYVPGPLAWRPLPAPPQTKSPAQP